MNNTHHLVTGCAGFIASHLIDRLLREGASVTGIDNLKLGRLSNLEQALQNSKFKFIEADVSRSGNWQDELSEINKFIPVDTVWHLAANSDIQAGSRSPQVDLEDTFLTTFHVLETMRRLEVKKIVFASSSAIYGKVEGLIDEKTPCRPASNYGAMKLASEGLLSSSLELFLDRVWIVRFPNVIGPRSTHGVIYDLLRKLKNGQDPLQVLGDGSQEKPYLHVADLVDAMDFVYRNSKESFSCYNISPRDSVTVRFIAEAVRDHVKPSAGIVYGNSPQGWVGDVPKYAYDTSALTRLGWTAGKTSKEAVLMAVKEIAAEIF